MKDPWGQWKQGSGGRSPHAFLLPESIKTFQDRRGGTKRKTTTMSSRSSWLGSGSRGASEFPHSFMPLFCLSLQLGVALW